ncbi:uncharacterized protein LOC142634576 [Castanea sativa]|uniref:uncharacterized protein LOC142634576 n=1 Tax=Castanea sativa TaxID=21020 RepID=UPI003F6526E2
MDVYECNMPCVCDNASMSVNHHNFDDMLLEVMGVVDIPNIKLLKKKAKKCHKNLSRFIGEKEDLPLLKRKPAQAGPAPASLDSDKPLLKSGKRKMMFAPFVAGMFFSRKRKAIEILPESVKTLWNKWELRSMVIFSLFLQGILMVLGKSRNHSRRNWVRIILWLAYLWADTVATASLGVLSSNQGESEGGFVDPNYVITVFWAPFLLLHLGGPDTITAYSLEDNELWLRHLLGLLVQVGGVVYVFLTTWTSTNALYFMAIPIFFAGIIKYGERTWVLMSASSEHFRDSMLSPPDPGPNYARFMEEYKSKKQEGFKVCSEKKQDAQKEENYSYEGVETDSRIPEARILNTAYMFFEIFKKLPANLILSFHDIQKSQYFIKTSSCDEAFKLIEVELGFMYDVFHTKAVLVHSFKGVVFRLITSTCTVAVFVAFFKIEKHIYSRVDVSITYILLVGAILLEFYAFVVLVCSDWTIVWLRKHKNFGVDLLYHFISLILRSRNKRWSNAMGQYNLIRYCLKDNPAKYRYNNSVDVPPELKILIFEEFQNRIDANHSDGREANEFCAYRGDKVIAKIENISDETKDENLELLKQSVKEEFDKSILLWHIATDLCYYWDQEKKCSSMCDSYCKASKLLSDYMMHLLVMCPFMLPNGIGETRVRDTCAEARGFFKERKSITNVTQACLNLKEVNTEIPPSDVKGDRSKSVLFDACRLAKSLQFLENNSRIENKWKLVEQVWVEMLSYAASHCGWQNHAQQLRRGGELLTHVWLLMAHFGFTEQYQISTGHAKVKLIVQ